MQLENLLLKYWGFHSFRPLQKDIIQSVMEGNDTLALMPTGGGKSICFQIPALANEGLCLVVTPLIALMKDQVENLKLKGIKAAALHSGLHPNEYGMVVDNCLYGGVKLLYVSPERLDQNEFKEVLRRLKLNLIAVDEAHCISQWGYDFRPSYLKIAEIRSFFPGIPVLALTATATPAVVDDIQDKLKFQHRNIKQKSFLRKNLIYGVVKEEDKHGKVLRVLKKINGSGIIYVRSRRKTKEYSDYLQKNNIRAGFYHAGLSNQEREKVQEDWMRGRIRTIVCTNAFGMGIDKPDVRFVIHLDVPDSLEAYFQEAGRAGRDEKTAYAILLYSEADIHRLNENLDLSYPPVEKIKAVYQALGNYYQLAIGNGKGMSFDIDIREFSERYNFKPLIAFNSLRFLEKEGYLMLSEYSDQQSRFHIPLSKEDLYRFQVENPGYDNFIKMLLRSYSGPFSDFVIINEKEIARRMNMPEEKVKKALHFLNSREVIIYLPSKNKPQLTFIVERLDKKDLYISPENYQTRKEVAIERIESVIEYAGNISKCRSLFLLNYFGERNVKRCGICDVCRKRNKISVNELEFNKVNESIKPLLMQQSMTLEDIVSNVPFMHEDKVIQVIQWLRDNDKIKEADGMFQWNRKPGIFK